jgi:hypothetical protein
MYDFAMANIEDALRRYREDRFTDTDVTRCTGLSVRALRELIKVRAIRTQTEGRGPGRVRVCDATALKRAAVISALNQAGLSLAVAGRVAYFMPFHTLLYTVCDPLTILFQRRIDSDSRTELPPRVQRPIVDWFDPDKPATANPETDWLIGIYDGRYVAAIYNSNLKDEPTIFGDLRQHGARFVAWFPFHRRNQITGGAIGEMARELLPYYRFVDFVAEWSEPTKYREELKSFNYEYEEHDTHTDPLCVEAEAAARSPLFKTTINITLAVRRALRRYLGIEPAAPDAGGAK